MNLCEEHKYAYVLHSKIKCPLCEEENLAELLERKVEELEEKILELKRRIGE
jgi:hypothetical protein